MTHGSLGGDFNATPDENPFLYTLEDLNSQCWNPSVPTRWSGDRCIDYFLGNMPPTSIVALEHVVADHYIVESQVSLRLPISKAWVQAPAARLPSLSQLGCNE